METYCFASSYTFVLMLRMKRKFFSKIVTELMKAKQESEKVGLKLNIQNTKIMVSGPITSWQIEGEKAQAVTEFILK